MTSPAASTPAGPLVIALASLKGGVGKTTSAVHIAAHLAYAGERVLLADGDRIRTATAWGRGGKMPFTVGGMTMLSQAAKYSAIVIDSRGGLEDADLVELGESCSALILPSTPDLGGMDGMAQTVEVLRGAGIPQGRYAALLTMVRPGSERKLADARAALSDAGIPALHQTVRLSEAFRDANNGGVLVRDVRGNSLAKGLWTEYERVTQEIVQLAGVGA
ncbi:chromosome partitioning protein [Deinococcus reticulitermitis]|uniref:Chromosome partitioning protein n=1 Tax=Deinococcus reticulitermitis TaxID=856736 RepID=A0A1H7CW87_9DEIO|nr:ParA family protein [Deinococcus reticulitermitis]SEJ91000.1 chromosome partitioning protein [Deinococcus reticulitermitis]